MRVVVKLPDGWVDVSKENPDGPPTFVKDGTDLPGVLQVSLQAQYVAGEVPSPGESDLVELVGSVFAAESGYVSHGTSSGRCAFGRYGSAVGSADGLPHLAAWMLSDGRNFILATFVCTAAPTSDEVEEVESVVRALTLTTAKRRWWQRG